MEDKNNAKAMVLASFTADSFALGAHWIYDVNEIKEKFGKIETLLAPGPDSYHASKNKGDFTHYGDQMLVLLESIAECKKFDLHDFSKKWRKLFEDYKGYMDGATKKTLIYYSKGRPPEKAGSHTGDFGGASRIAPVLYAHRDNMELMAEAARIQTSMTHNDPLTLDTAEFFAKATYLVLNGTPPVSAIKEIAGTDRFEMTPIEMWVEEGFKSKNQDTVSAISRFGQACETNQVFPGVIHLISKYENNLKKALTECVMAGGDSAARGSMTAMVMGAYLGMDAIDPAWLNGMNKKSEICSLLDKIN